MESLRHSNDFGYFVYSPATEPHGPLRTVSGGTDQTEDLEVDVCKLVGACSNSSTRTQRS